MIALVDYGAGNLTSVRKAFAALSGNVQTPTTPAQLAEAEALVVPGVGHFAALGALEGEWRREIVSAIERGVPTLGICLGLQWLFKGSRESAGVAGLGIFRGTCERLPERVDGVRQKVPHVGWNSLQVRHAGGLLAGVADGAQVYFTHSYAAPVVEETAGITDYGAPFSAVVERANIAAVQFHPEKSGEVGLQVLRNWLSGVACARRGDPLGSPALQTAAGRRACPSTEAQGIPSIVEG